MITDEKEVFDYIIVGSGFGGSVSAMRLTEKGYSVLVLERGKRFNDLDFAKSNWNVFRYIWAPKLRCFGIMQLSFFRHVLVLHGSGVGTLMDAVRAAYVAAMREMPTPELTRVLEAAIRQHQPPLVRGRRIRLQRKADSSVHKNRFRSARTWCAAGAAA